MTTPVRRAGWSGRLEGVILILLGLTTGGFALFGDYPLLMNPKFGWLEGPILCTCGAALRMLHCCSDTG